MKQLKLLLLVGVVMFLTACRDDSFVVGSSPMEDISSIEQVPSAEDDSPAKDDSSVVEFPQTNTDADPNAKVSQTITGSSTDCEETTPSDEENNTTVPSNTAQWDSSNWDELKWQ